MTFVTSMPTGEPASGGGVTRKFETLLNVKKRGTVILAGANDITVCSIFLLAMATSTA